MFGLASHSQEGVRVEEVGFVEQGFQGAEEGHRGRFTFILLMVINLATRRMLY